MADIDEKTLKHQIKNGLLSPVYLLYGNESYLKRHYMHAICESAVGAMGDFNLHVFDGQEAKMEDILSAAQSYPMMGGKSCVAVTDLPMDTLPESGAAMLDELLIDPLQTCVVVFLMERVEASPKKNAKWRKIFEKVNQAGSCVRLDKMAARSLAQTLASGAKKRGCSFAPEAAQYLVTLAGDDLNTLLNELEKCCAFQGEGEITQKTIDAVCVKSLDATAFDLVRAITSRNCEQAYSLLEILFAQRAEPLMIHGALTAAFVDMYRARVGLDSSGDALAAAKCFNYKNKEFRLRNGARNARDVSVAQLRLCLDALDELDRLLKGGGSNERLILEQGIVRLLMITGGK